MLVFFAPFLTLQTFYSCLLFRLVSSVKNIMAHPLLDSLQPAFAGRYLDCSIQLSRYKLGRGLLFYMPLINKGVFWPFSEGIIKLFSKILPYSLIPFQWTLSQLFYPPVPIWQSRFYSYLRSNGHRCDPPVSLECCWVLCITFLWSIFAHKFHPVSVQSAGYYFQFHYLHQENNRLYIWEYIADNLPLKYQTLLKVLLSAPPPR